MDSIKQIMAKSGSPTLSASYDKTQLFGGTNNDIELYEGDVVQWMKNEITQFAEKAKTLPQGDVLVTTGNHQNQRLLDARAARQRAGA